MLAAVGEAATGVALLTCGMACTSQSVGYSSKGESNGDEKVARSGCCP